MTTAAIVLAAGKGTRFRSEVAKVLHPVAGRTMLRWVLEALRPLALDRVVVVVGHQAEAVAAEADAAELPGLSTVVQGEQRGTGHAVRVALESGAVGDADTVLVLPGDVPLLTPDALQPLLAAHAGRAVTLLTAELDDPSGYGRVVRGEGGAVERIVEHRDASPAELAVAEVNSSIYAFAASPLRRALAALDTDNDQGEEYLTDAVAPLAAGEGGAGAVVVAAELVAGANDRVQLAEAGTVLRRRILDDLPVAAVLAAAGNEVRLRREATLDGADPTP